MSRLSLFSIEDFFLVCANSQRPTKKSLYKPNQDTWVVPAVPPTSAAQTPVWLPSLSPWDRSMTHWGKESARRTPEQSRQWPVWEWAPHMTHISCWHSNPIWTAKPGSKEQHNVFIKLVLQCQSCTYQMRRWGNFPNTACLPPVLHSDLSVPDARKAKVRIHVGKAQDVGGKAKAGLTLLRWPSFSEVAIETA